MIITIDKKEKNLNFPDNPEKKNINMLIIIKVFIKFDLSPIVNEVNINKTEKQ